MKGTPLPLKFLGLLPLRFSAGVAWLLAWIWWLFFPIRRGEALQNLQRALPMLPPRSTLVRMMRELILGYLEMLRFSSLAITVTGAEGPREHPGIMLGGHSGSWDIGLLVCGDQVPTASFLHRPGSRWVEDWLTTLREAHGVLCLWDGSSLKEGLAVLDSGRNLFFVQDQRLNRGMLVPFFGQPARTSVAFAAAIQRRPGRPVWTAWCYRLGIGRHHVHFAPFPMPERSNDPEEDRRILTEAANRWYEERIRERPWGWLWLHRRWK